MIVLSHHLQGVRNGLALVEGIQDVLPKPGQGPLAKLAENHSTRRRPRTWCSFRWPSGFLVRPGYETQLEPRTTPDNQTYDGPSHACGKERAADLLREMLGFADERLMELEVGAKAGADYGEKSSERLAQRHGYRERDWQTRAGSVGLRIPKLRTGS